MTWREPATGSLANPAVPLPPWPAQERRPPAHGTARRYKYAADPCRSACPASPTCREAYNAAQRAARAARRTR